MAANQEAVSADLLNVERLAQRGWKVFPCYPHSKAPRLKGWQTVATSDLATIRRWAAKYPGCNWAVMTGPDSGVFVLDIDGGKGRASLASLEARYGPLSVTLISHTGRADGGEHRWFMFPAGRELRNSTGRLDEGLDIRANGGYVVVPPSIHDKTERHYQWGETEQPVADAPAWLIDQLTDKTGKQLTIRPERFGALADGKRNVGLARYAGALRRKGAELAELEEKLLSYNARNCLPPKEEKEVRKVAASIARYPVGGPDPLELAWQSVEGKGHLTHKAQFLELCRQLQTALHDESIALPIERIGELMGVHWTTVSTYRKDAVRRGWLKPIEQYVAHRRAAHYRLIEDRIPKDTETLTKPPENLTSGLVRIFPSESPDNSPSENIESVPQIGRAGAEALHPRAFPKCPNCESFALYRPHNIGEYECLTCGMTGITEDVARLGTDANN